jgi:uncharacterized membrane protein YdjX (TVP38/TMEM64 family)
LRSYWKLAAALLGFLLAIFLVFEALGVDLIGDPTNLVAGSKWSGAAIGVGLLIADVFIPVPSSFLMVFHGALFGVWIGTLLSLIGTVGAALLGFAVGRAGGSLMERMVSAEEKRRADELLGRWGALAIVVTRPIPLLAETVAILAGTSPLRWYTVALAAAAGALPPALLFALTGAYARDFGSVVLVFGFVLLMTGLFWLVGRRLGGGSDHPVPSE